MAGLGGDAASSYLVEVGEVDGLGWGVVQALGLDELPCREHWESEEFAARLFGLASRGVKLEGLMAWALHVAGGNTTMLDCKEVVDHVQALLVDNHHAVVGSVAVSPGAAGVANILGPDLPTVSKWRDLAWVRALLELPACGVQLADFHAWCRDAAAREIIAPKTETISECHDEFPASPDSQEVDGPSPPSKVKIVIEVDGEVGRKRKRGEEMTVNVTAANRTTSTVEAATHSENPAEAQEPRN